MVILYNPPSSANRKPILPMSLLALGAVLEGDYDYRIIDGNLEPDPYTALDIAIRDERAPVMLAVTVMPGPQLNHAVPLCKELKRRYPTLIIAWGGYFPTQHYDVCLQSGFVDYVVRGHGELVFRSLVEDLAAGRQPQAVRGLCYRAPDGSLTSAPAAAIPHPDDLPEFPHHRLPMERYVRRTFMGQRTLPHHSSYGCPFFCNFCAVVNMVEGRWLAQSAERTATTTQRLVRDYGADAVEFYDNNFFVHETRTVEFAERINHLGISWWGEARIDTLMKYSDASWRLMRDSGLQMVFLGAESGSNETLHRMNKGGKASIEKTLEIAARMRQYDIVPEMSFVLGNPPDPERDARQTINFIRKVKEVNPRTEVILYMYTPVPLAGELYDQARAQGFQFPESLEEWISPDWQEFSQRRSTHVPWVQDPLRRAILDFQWVLNAYYPTSTDVSLTRARRLALRALSSWRYRMGFYQYPLELRAFHKIVSYQRPETSGF